MMLDMNVHTVQYLPFNHRLDFSIEEVFESFMIRMLAFQRSFQHIYFALQRLYLLPQGRASFLRINTD
jgi:hypothetical protein